MKIKAISLYQPYATLIAIEAKRIETRGWSTNYRGPLAIHVCKKQSKEYRELEKTKFFKGALYPNGNYLYPWASCGCVLAIVDLMDCFKITGHRCFQISEQEKAFGNYTLGRFMLMLENVKKLDKPIPAIGHQKLWDWEIPAELLL
jgi:hypothetical protein